MVLANLREMLLNNHSADCSRSTEIASLRKRPRAFNLAIKKVCLKNRLQFQQATSQRILSGLNNIKLLTKLWYCGTIARDHVTVPSNGKPLKRVFNHVILKCNIFSWLRVFVK